MNDALNLTCFDRVNATSESIARALKGETPGKTRRLIRPAVAAACIAALALGAGILFITGRHTPAVKPEDGSPTAIVSTQPTTTTPTLPPDGTGGDVWFSSLWMGSSACELYIPQCAVEAGLLSRKELNEWTDAIVYGRRPPMEGTIYHFVREFGVRREFFENKVRALHETTSDPFLKTLYSPDEIDMIYSDDFTPFVQHFANPCALAVGDRIYTPDWLSTHTVEEWHTAGITPEMIREKEDIWRSYFGYSLPDTPKYRTLEEKVNAFCK